VERKLPTGGSHRAGREREGSGAGLARLGWVTGRYLGPGLAQVAEASSSPFFLFCFPFLLFSDFLFSISLITFAFVTQMTSNQFVKFSKIQLNILRQ
jgi:hypothetical protein